MINNLTLVGRLTKDVELKFSESGLAIATLYMAVQRNFKNQNGEYEADFPIVKVFRNQAENAANYLKKGSMCGVTGRISTRSYDDQSGKRVYITEVIADGVQFLEPKKSGNQNQNGQSNQPPKNPPRSYNEPPPPLDISDDDLPF